MASGLPDSGFTVPKATWNVYRNPPVKTTFSNLKAPKEVHLDSFTVWKRYRAWSLRESSSVHHVGRPTQAATCRSPPL